MNKRVKITVVIPTFDRRAATDRAVQSVLAQTRMPDEIIVVDDGSTIAYENAAPQVRVIRCAYNRGPAAARNFAIEVATGDYLAFLDSDDIWFPNKLAKQEAQLAGIADHKVALVCGFQYNDQINNREKSVIPSGCYTLEEFAGGCLFNPGSTLIVHRQIFREIGLFHEGLRRLEDYEWFLRFALSGGAVESVPEVLVQINKGLRPDPQVINRIIRSVRQSTDQLSGLAGSRAQAYLALEQASAHWYARNPAKFLWYFGASLVRSPRFGIQLNRVGTL